MKVATIIGLISGVATVGTAQGQTPTEAMLEYAKCIGQTDGYLVAAEPYMNGDTLLLDLHHADVETLRSALSELDWADFQANRTVGLREWEARIAVIQVSGGMDSPEFTEHATIAWECGQQRQRLVAAGVFEQ